MSDELASEHLTRARREVPEHRDAADPVSAASVKTFAAVLHATVGQLSGERLLPPACRDLVASVAESQADEGFPMSVGLRCISIAHQILLDRTLLLCSETEDDVSGLARTHIRILADLEAVYSGSYLTRRSQRAAIHQQAIDDLLADLALGKRSDLLERRAQILGINGALAYTVFAIPTEGEDWRLNDDARNLISSVVRDRFPAGTLRGTVGTGLVMIVPAPTATELKQLTSLLEDTLSQILPPEWRAVGIGTTRSGLDGIARSFNEALEVLDVARLLGRTGAIHTSEVLLPRMLASARHTSAELSEMLAPVMAEDDGSDLLQTLSAYIDHGCNAQSAADALFLHRNTLRNRLARIERILGIAIVGNTTVLHLAILARDLVSTATPPHA